MSDNRYPVALQPLDNSAVNSQFEADIYQMFQDLIEDYIRPTERDLNVGAVPHLGSFDLVSRNVEVDGLALINNDDEAAMRYLYKAWKARNPKRGTHFLKTYLQLLFGNGWKVEQLWHPVATVNQYPELVQTKRTKIDGDAFLTSRVRVSIAGKVGEKDYLERITPAIRSILPARLLLETRGFVLTRNEIGIANHLGFQGRDEKQLTPSRVNPKAKKSNAVVASSLSISLQAHQKRRPQLGSRLTSSNLGATNLLRIKPYFLKRIEPIVTVSDEFTLQVVNGSVLQLAGNITKSVRPTLP